MKEPFIDMRLWRQFAAVAEELHFGRAAQRLHMTQPPLTQAIAGLERTLGLQLFDRTKRSVQLTPAGAALLPQVLDLLDRAQALPAQARAAAAGGVGRLRLGFVSTVGFGMLPQWVRGFRAPGPGVRRGMIEAAGGGQPLARTPTVRFSDLLREPLVIFPRPILPSLYDAIVALYHAAGQVPQVAQEA